MSASLDAQAKISLSRACEARALLDVHQREFADAYLRYLRDSKEAGWSLKRIAVGLSISEAAVRRYWTTHRQRVGRLSYE